LNGRVEDARRPEPDNARRLMGSAFVGDDGSAPAEVTTALASYAVDPGTSEAVLAALVDSRLLVPVVAVLGDVEYDDAGLAHDKTSDMATVLMRGADGRTALLAFTSTATLQAWQADARPVAVGTRDAARAAIQDGADALVIDIAGPTAYVVGGQDLQAVAAGYVLGRVGERSAWLAP
jgi:hypothetical protein